MPNTPEPSRLRTTEEILARQEELCAVFESDDFDGVRMTPAEYRDYRAKRRAERRL